MEIKGPSAPSTLDVQAPSVRPASPSGASTPAMSQGVQPNTVQLSPSLFTVGQLLEVVVSKIETNALLLMLQNPILDENGQRINLQLRAPTNFPAEPGQQLMVQVKNITNGVPQLQVLAAKGEDLNPANLLHTAQQQQRPLPPLYANLAELQRLQNKQLLDLLPALVRERIQALWRSLPDTAQVQKPAGLKQAMGYSGPFLEASLHALARGEGQHYPARDVKTGLLRLANAIRAQLNTATLEKQASEAHARLSDSLPPASMPTRAPNTAAAASGPATTNAAAADAPTTSNPANTSALHAQIPQSQARAVETVTQLTTEHLLNQLLQQTEGGLARILTQQLHTANHDPQRPIWLLELPVRHEGGVDVFDLRIQRDPEEQAKAAQRARHTWTVMLGFDLQGLGPVRAQVSLVQNQISTYWWAQQTSTVDLFHQHMAQLQHRISATGLKVDKLQCKLGIPDTNKPSQPVPMSNVNLDEKL